MLHYTLDNSCSVSCVCCRFVPDHVVVAYEHQVLQYGEEIGLRTAVLHHTLHNTEHIPHIGAESQGIWGKLEHCISHLKKRRCY